VRRRIRRARRSRRRLARPSMMNCWLTRSDSHCPIKRAIMPRPGGYAGLHMSRRGPAKVESLRAAATPDLPQGLPKKISSICCWLILRSSTAIRCRADLSSGTASGAAVAISPATTNRLGRPARRRTPSRRTSALYNLSFLTPNSAAKASIGSPEINPHSLGTGRFSKSAVAVLEWRSPIKIHKSMTNQQ
jgi:hypothetical protein